LNWTIFVILKAVLAGEQNSASEKSSSTDAKNEIAVRRQFHYDEAVFDPKTWNIPL
jgi:hypothetical protein